MEDRLRAAADHVEIQSTLARYGHALDDRRWDLLASCFTADATLETPYTGSTRGIEEITAACRRAIESLDLTQHLIGAAHIEVGQDAASSHCRFQAQHVRQDLEGGGLYVIAGTYIDRFRRTDQGWRIAHRELSPTWTQGDRRVLEPRPRP